MPAISHRIAPLLALAALVGVAIGAPTSGAVTSRPTRRHSRPTGCGGASAGYWLVGADGRVFALDGARSYGSPDTRRLRTRVVALVPIRDGRGYRLIGADGQILAFGDARVPGAPSRVPTPTPLVGGAVAPTTCQGVTGARGPAGAQGPTGTAGSPGPVGAQGSPGPVGAQGSVGPVGAQGSVGPVGPDGAAGAPGPEGPPAVFRGSWASSASYTPGDAVAYGGSSYVALQGSTGVVPPSDPADWVVLAAAGATGPVGARGATGPSGPQGPPVTFLGTWSAASAYQVGDVVAYGGSSYVALTANGGINPATDVSGSGGNWAVLAAQGGTGATGPQGPAGGLAGYADLYLPATTATIAQGGALVGLQVETATSGLVYDATTGALSVASAGTYRLDYALAASAGSSFGIDVGGAPVPACSGVPIGSGLRGTCMVPLAAGAIVTLVNTSPGSAQVQATAPENAATLSVELVS